MALSLKSLNFAKKILKHNPLYKSRTSHNQQQHAHNHQHQNCTHQHQHSHTHQPQQQSQQLRPYLHVHDHRKVHLQSYKIKQEREIYQKPTQQKLNDMQLFKQQGNEHFKNKRFKQAIHYYQKIIIYSDYTFPQDEKGKQLMNELVQSANCNLGISINKLGEYKRAIDNFRQAAKGPLSKIVMKSTYWLAKNHIKLGDFKQANEELQKLRSYNQQTKKQVEQLQVQLKTAQLSYQQTSKTLYGQMFTTNCSSSSK